MFQPDRSICMWHIELVAGGARAGMCLTRCQVQSQVITSKMNKF